MINTSGQGVSTAIVINQIWFLLLKSILFSEREKKIQLMAEKYKVLSCQVEKWALPWWYKPPAIRKRKVDSTQPWSQGLWCEDCFLPSLDCDTFANLQFSHLWKGDTKNTIAKHPIVKTEWDQMYTPGTQQMLKKINLHLFVLPKQKILQWREHLMWAWRHNKNLKGKKEGKSRLSTTDTLNKKVMKPYGVLEARVVLVALTGGLTTLWASVAWFLKWE